MPRHRGGIITGNAQSEPEAQAGFEPDKTHGAARLPRPDSQQLLRHTRRRSGRSRWRDKKSPNHAWQQSKPHPICRPSGPITFGGWRRG